MLGKADTPILARIFSLMKYSDMWKTGDNPNLIRRLIQTAYTHRVSEAATKYKFFA